MDGVFVTGTDTGVGKSLVCAGLLKALHSKKPVYWKPIQTGTIVGDDTRAVKSLTDLGPEYFWDPVYRFPEPLSPHMAAKKWGQTVDADKLVKYYDDKKSQKKFVIVEGAGGLLVPFNEKTLQVHFIQRLGFPIIIVSEDRVGAINQCLLTINAAREAGIEILGIVLTRARRTLGNADAISLFGKVPILAQLEPSEDSKTIVGQVGAHDTLREIFKISTLPNV
jgi:dethiobiotin synthase